MPSELASVLSLEVPVIVLLGERKMKLSEVISLIPGAIIELPKGSEEELTLLINNKAIGNGSAVKVGENFGVRMTFVGDLKSRITALGAGQGRRGPAPTAAAGRADDPTAAGLEAAMAGRA